MYDIQLESRGEMMDRAIILIIGLGLLWPASVQADIYKYVDRQGRIHFTDKPTRSGYKLYLKTGRSGSRDVDRLIEHYAEKFSLEKALMRAVVKVESDFNPRAVSRKGAQGLMQLMPGTAHEMGVSDPFDPEDSLHGGGRYRRKQLDRFGTLDLALAAYNAGPSVVEKYQGIPPFEETQNYVKKVRYYLKRYRNHMD